jgi:hypothetical protein
MTRRSEFSPSSRAAFWAAQLETAFFARPEGPWHGPSLLAAVRVDAETARIRLPQGGHTIFELVRHLTLWHDAVRRRLEGDRSWVRRGDDWRPVEDASAAAWKQAVLDLRHASERLIDVVRALDEPAFAANLPGKSYSAEFLISGVVQHAAYHAGQMRLLGKRG